jgi:hypothetical protein
VKTRKRRVKDGGKRQFKGKYKRKKRIPRVK